MRSRVSDTFAWELSVSGVRAVITRAIAAGGGGGSGPAVLLTVGPGGFTVLFSREPVLLRREAVGRVGRPIGSGPRTVVLAPCSVARLDLDVDGPLLLTLPRRSFAARRGGPPRRPPSLFGPARGSGCLPMRGGHRPLDGPLGPLGGYLVALSCSLLAAQGRIVPQAGGPLVAPGRILLRLGGRDPPVLGTLDARGCRHGARLPAISPQALVLDGPQRGLGLGQQPPRVLEAALAQGPLGQREVRGGDAALGCGHRLGALAHSLLEPADVLPKALGGLLGATVLLLPAYVLARHVVVSDPLTCGVHVPRVPATEATGKSLSRHLGWNSGASSEVVGAGVRDAFGRRTLPPPGGDDLCETGRPA